MYHYLSGKLVQVKDANLVIDVEGIGYEVGISLRSLAQIPKTGELIKLYIYFHVKEDAHILYGFFHEEEKEMFKLLLGVTGIGPKMAMTILGKIGPEDLRLCVEARDEEQLSSIPGIGKKTASRLILEMKDKIGGVSFLAADGRKAGLKSSHRFIKDACMALVNLGYTRAQAQEAIDQAIKEFGTPKEIEELIKNSIQKINR